jgi:hypothetical protein
VIGQEIFDHCILFINGHMADIKVHWAVLADVPGLVTLVAWLWGHVECLGLINWCEEARWECAQRGRHCCQGCGCQCMRSKEGDGGSRWCWLGGWSCDRTSRGVVKHLVCQSVKVKPLCSLEPALEIIVLWSISARRSDIVLGGGMKTSVKLQDDCDVVHIARECNKLPELIGVCVNVSPPLEVVVKFEHHQSGGHLIL